MFSSPQRQHPTAIFFMFLRLIREMILPLLFLAVTTFSSGAMTDQRMPWIIGIGTLLLSAMIIGSILSWWRFTYYIHDGELRIQQGLFLRKRRFIPQEKIQTINVSAGVLQRLFQVVKLEVETAGGTGGAEATLVALTREEALELKALLVKQYEPSHHNGEYPLANTVYRLSKKDLIIAASTSASVGLVFSLLIAGLSQLNQLLPNIDLFSLVTQYVESNVTMVLILVPILAAISWLLSIIGTMLKYAFFTVTKTEKDLYITRGLLEKRELTLPLKRIQAVRISEGLIRQLFGFVTIHVENAGYAEESGGSAMIFPLLRRKDLKRFLTEMVPDFHLHDDWQPLPKRALPRYLIRGVFPALIIAIPFVIWVPLGYVAFILPLIAGWLMLYRYLDAGFTAQNNFICLRFRRLNRTTIIVPKQRIQLTMLKRSIVQKRLNLCTFSVSVISGTLGAQFGLRDMHSEHGDMLYEWSTPQQGLTQHNA